MPVSSRSSRTAACRLLSPACTAPPVFSQYPAQDSLAGSRRVSSTSRRLFTTQMATAVKNPQSGSGCPRRGVRPSGRGWA